MALNLDKFIWVERIVEGRKNPQRQKKFLHTCNKCDFERGYFVKTWDVARSNGLCISCTKLELGPTVNKGLCSLCNEKPAISNQRCGSCNSKEYRKYHPKKKQVTKIYDINHKLKRSLRTRLYGALKGNYKAGSAVKDLGCSIEELKKYLESKFYHNKETGEVMSWNNWSVHGWHIDHKRPLAAFDLSNPEQFKDACNYKNLQPLWSQENLSKGDRIGC